MTHVPADVADDEPLHRRVHPSHVRDDGIPSSQAFQDEAMSVDRGRFRDPQDTLTGYNGYGLASIQTDYARAEGQQVVSAPETVNPAHALVNGSKPKSLARRLARSSCWVVRVPESNSISIADSEEREIPEAEDA